MKPSEIFSILDLARRARKNNFKFAPCFVGAPGLGKSEIVQQWCTENKLPFIDLRLAYREAPDLIGFPTVSVKNGRERTCFSTPEFWPDGDIQPEGVLLLEEPNRGTTAIMNCIMQLLTDRKVDKYELPKGWIIVGCINPEEADYDVNTMDSALKDRFEFFNVNYDKESFIQFMNDNNWDETVRMFVESGAWNYTLPGTVGNAPGAKYISPRTFSKLNAVVQSNIPNELEQMVYESILGQLNGGKYHHFKYEEQPVLYSDLVNNQTRALKRLKKFADPKDYKAGHFSITIRNIVESDVIEDDLLAEVLEVIPADVGYTLISELEFKRKDTTIGERIKDTYPKLKKKFAEVLKKTK